MSSQVNITSAITVTPSVALGGVYSAVSSTAFIVGQGVENRDGYAYFGLKSGASTESYYEWGFDLSEIPRGSTINSVTCQARCVITNTATGNVATRIVQLYTGDNTPKGTGVTITTGYTGVRTLDCGSWTREELDTCRIRFTGIRGTSNPKSVYTIRVFGATLSVDYTFEGTMYDVSANSSYSGVSVTPANQEIGSGSDATVKIYTDKINRIKVEDNNTVVTSGFTYVEPPLVYLHVHPSSFDEENSVYSGVYSTNVKENGFNPCHNTSRCALYSLTGEGVSSCMYYNFDCSSVPNDAIIESIVCRARCSFQSGRFTTGNSNTFFQMYVGTTPVGNRISVSGTFTTASVTTSIQGSGTISGLSRSDLDDIKIKYQVLKNSTCASTQSTFNFWGASLSVAYRMPSGYSYYAYTISGIDDDHVILVSEKPGGTKVKIAGDWVDVGTVWVRENGSWVDRTADYETIFASDKVYVRKPLPT